MKYTVSIRTDKDVEGETFPQLYPTLDDAWERAKHEVDKVIDTVASKVEVKISKMREF